ncbi:MAG: hypothetical protein HOB69_09955 [Flavobacterium sp.]|jgi:thiamine monophosphate synthase|nr:hypothetical protein [Flavobacterium sp.]
MFAYKKKYFLIIESIKDINLRNIKIHKKFIIIYRNLQTNDHIEDLKKFRKQCRIRSIKFYVANNIALCVLLKSDGIYLSSFNKSFKSLNLKRANFRIIGSAHSSREIIFKIKQGCNYILLSKLFTVDYDEKSKILGIIMFNNYLKNMFSKLIPLGGIKVSNLNKLKTINCEAVSLLSEIKKKPTKIIGRLF